MFLNLCRYMKKRAYLTVMHIFLLISSITMFLYVPLRIPLRHCTFPFISKRFSLLVNQRVIQNILISRKYLYFSYYVAKYTYFIHGIRFCLFFCEKPSKIRIKWDTFQGTIYLWPYWMLKIYMSHLSSPRFTLQWHHATVFLLAWQ
jgi:hypothetical protein